MSTPLAAFRIRDLQALLAQCEPDGVVEIALPAFLTAGDAEVCGDDADHYTSHTYIPEVFTSSVSTAPGYSPSPDARPNHVTIQLSDIDHAALVADRKRACASTAAPALALTTAQQYEVNDALNEVIERMVTTGQTAQEIEHRSLPLLWGVHVALIQQITGEAHTPGIARKEPAVMAAIKNPKRLPPGR